MKIYANVKTSKPNVRNPIFQFQISTMYNKRWFIFSLSVFKYNSSTLRYRKLYCLPTITTLNINFPTSKVWLGSFVFFLSPKSPGIVTYSELLPWWQSLLPCLFHVCLKEAVLCVKLLRMCECVFSSLLELHDLP